MRAGKLVASVQGLIDPRGGNLRKAYEAGAKEARELSWGVVAEEETPCRVGGAAATVNGGGSAQRSTRCSRCRQSSSLLAQ